MEKLNDLQIEPTVTLKALIIDGKICFSINKEEWKVEEVDDIYIISSIKKDLIN